MSFIKSMFSAPKPPVLPPILEPAVMPDPDDKAGKTRKLREVQMASQRSGRLSTINTAPGTTVLG